MVLSQQGDNEGGTSQNRKQKKCKAVYLYLHLNYHFISLNLFHSI